MQTTPASHPLLAVELERLSAIWMVLTEQQTPGVCADIALFAMQNRAAIIAALRVADEAVVRYVTVGAEAVAQAESDRANWPPYNSAHEGFAVINEEFDELKVHVWTNQKRRDIAAMRAEAIQLAACAIAFAADICTDERGRR